MPSRPQLRARAQRGFTLLEVAVWLAIGTTFVLATASVWGRRPPQAHAAALAFEAALAEARSVAVSTADATDSAVATGATVYVAPLAGARGSLVTVYRSRPVPAAAPGAPSVPLQRDSGFARVRVSANLGLDRAGITTPAPFAILVSSGGYASIVAPMAWDPGASGAVLVADPGCDEGTVAVSADDGVRRESHSLACRNAVYDATR